MNDPKSKKTPITFLFLTILTLSVCSCFIPQGRTDEDLFVMGLESRAASLDPRFATDAASSKLCDLLFSGLVRVTDDGDYEGDLAERWDIEEGVVYRFHLKPDIRFHDGSFLNSGVIKANLESVMAKSSISPKKADFAFVQSISIIDDLTLEIRLNRPFAPFLKSCTLGIVPESAASDTGVRLSEHPIGTGPFQYESEIPGQEYVFRRYEGYHGTAPELNRVCFRVIKDGMIRTLELMKGTIDCAQNDIPPRMVSLLGTNSTLRMRFTPSNNCTYLGFNLQHPLLSKGDVRRAIACAINRDAILEQVFFRLAIPSRGLLPPGHWAYNGDVMTYAYNPKHAMELLDRAGVVDPDGPGPQLRCTLEYKTSQNPFRLMIATIIQRDLRRIGIDVRLQSLEWPTFYDDIKKGNFELFSLMWVGVDEPDLYYHLFHSQSIPPVGANRGRYANPEVDRLLERSRFSLDRAERRTCYHDIQRIIAEELPYVSLWHEYNVAILGRRFAGYRVTPDASFRGLLSVIRNRSEP